MIAYSAKAHANTQCECCKEQDTSVDHEAEEHICTSCRDNDPIGKETGEWAHKQWRRNAS